MEIDRTSRRVLGSLIEKRWTTPDLYPLTLNALLAACNQKSNRDPVLELQDFEITGCIMQLRQAGLIVVHERDAGRTFRYGERVAEQLALSRQESAIMAELMLRGPQTAPELHRRCTRMAPDLASPDHVENMLGDMAGRYLVKLLPRETGQRHARWTHLLTPDSELQAAPTPAPAAEPSFSSSPRPFAPPPTAAPAAVPVDEASLAAEVEALRAEVASLRTQVQSLHAQLQKIVPPPREHPTNW